MIAAPLDLSLDFARQADANDSLSGYRSLFHFPQYEGQDVRYGCGNSLGLQPKATRDYLLRELEHWATHGVEGHFLGDMPWKQYHHFFKQPLANLVGALPEEVCATGTLSANLHHLFVSFYRPTSSRYKIIMEAGAFPSDQYIVETQVRFHDYQPEDAIIELSPREGEHSLRTEDIVAAIAEHGASLALVFFSGVQYYTGQYFNLQAITKQAHDVGAIAGFDLAHAIGNLPMNLHDWNVDFAAWCSYKYLNSGPGGPGGIFVHQRFAQRPDLPRFGGWWGQDEATRFQMKKGFMPMARADGWQHSNAPILSLAAHHAALDIFEQAGIAQLREKSLALTGYFYSCLETIQKEHNLFQIITPSNPEERGCQVSLLTDERGKSLHAHLTQNGIVSDWREPNVIRIAPVPLYNSFEDVWHICQLLFNFAQTH